MEKLSKRIDEILASHRSPVVAYSDIIELCHVELKLLREKVESSGFLSEEDEIVFFKQTKQLPLSSLIYYTEVQKITLEITAACDKPKRRKLIKRKLKYFSREIKKHKEFNSYIQLGHSHFDKYYFVRGAKNILPKQYIHPVGFDSIFSTSHDYLMGKLSAFNRLVEFLKKEFKKKEHSIPLLQWTSSKTSLIELIYALHQTKAINGGQCEIKDIANSFQRQFGIELGDIYRTYSEIKSRKTNQVKFLNQLKCNLIDKIDKEVA